VLPSEFDGVALLEREALEKAEIEIDTAWKREGVAADVAEGEPGGQGKRRGIVLKHAEYIGGDSVSLRLGDMVRVADEIGIRTAAVGAGDAVSNAGIVAKGGAVGDREGQAGLKSGDAGGLPSAEDGMREAGLLEERQRVNVTDDRGMTLIEIG